MNTVIWQYIFNQNPATVVAVSSDGLMMLVNVLVGSTIALGFC